jgi:hypothetical protein
MAYAVHKIKINCGMKQEGEGGVPRQRPESVLACQQSPEYPVVLGLRRMKKSSSFLFVVGDLVEFLFKFMKKKQAASLQLLDYAFYNKSYRKFTTH